MEIYSILLQSTKQDSLGKIFLSTTIAPSFPAAINNVIAKAIELNGDLQWKFALYNCLPVNQAPKTVAPIVKEDKPEPIKETKNWLLNKILETKDNILFESCKQYLTEPEILYINSKLNNEENKTR